MAAKRQISGDENAARITPAKAKAKAKAETPYATMMRLAGRDINADANSYSAMLAANLAKGATSSKASSDTSIIPVKGVSGGGGGKGFDFWNWAGDIIDRPRRMVGETAEAAMKAGADYGAALAHGKMPDVLGEMGNGLSAPFRGLFSTAKGDHSSTADIMENTRDTVGKLVEGKHYKNTANNLDPTLKGVGGFIGDLATDPLMYVGIGELGAAAKLGIKAVKGGEDALKGKALAKALGLHLGNYTGVNGAISVGKGIKNLVKGGKAGKDIAEAAAKAGVTAKDAEAAGKAMAEATQEAKGGEAAMPSSAAAAKEGEAAAAALGKPPVPGSPELSLAERTRQIMEEPGIAETAKGAAEGANPFAAEQTLPPSSVGDQLRSHPQSAELTSLLGKMMKRHTRMADSPDFNALDSFKAIAANPEDAVGKVLGPGLVSALKAHKSAPKFEESIAKLHGILTDSGHLEHIGMETELAGDRTPVGAMFKHLGINPREINVARRETGSAVAATAEGAPKPSIVGQLTADEAAATNAADKFAAKLNLGAEQDAAAELGKAFHGQIETDSLAGGRTTHSGARTDARPRGEATAKYADRWGTHGQMSYFAGLVKRASERMTKGNVAGAAASTAKRKTVLQSLRIGERILDERGVHIHMSDSEGRSIPLSVSQLLEHLGAVGPEAQRAIDMAFFNPATGVPLTQLMKAQIASHYGAEPAELMSILESVSKGEKKSGKDMQNFFHSNEERWGKVSFQKGAIPGEAPEGFKFEENAAKDGFYTLVSNKHLLREVTGSMLQARNDLIGTVQKNAASYAERFARETTEMSAEIKAKVLETVNDPLRLGDAILAINRPKTYARLIAQRSGARADSELAAVAQVEAELPPGAAETAKAAEEMAKAAENLDHEAADAARAKHAETADEVATEREQLLETEAPPEVTGVEQTVDIAAKLTRTSYRQVKASMMSWLDPVSERFNAAWAMNDQLPLYRMQHESVALQQDWWGVVKPEINALVKEHSVPVVEGSDVTRLQQALADVKNGVDSGPGIDAVRPLLEKHLARVFDVTGEQPLLGNVFARVGAPIEYLNTQLKSYKGLENFAFDIEKAELRASEEDIPLMHAVMDQWKEWDVKDVPAFLTSVNHMALKVTTHAALAESLVKSMKAEGLMAFEPTKGMLRVTHSKGTPLSAFIPEGARIHPEMGPGLQRLNEIMSESSKLRGDAANFIEKVFDPIQKIWKFGMTVIRPGHHIRNAVGDASMTFFAEGMKFAMQSSKDAFKVMFQHEPYGEMDFAKALNGLGAHEYKGGTESLVKLKIGGKDVGLTADDIYKSLRDRGGLPSFKHVEQIEDDSRGILNRAADKVTTGNKIGAKIGTLGEKRDHWSRVQHYLQILHKYSEDGFIAGPMGKKLRPKDLNQLMDLSLERVRTFHPDGTQLASFEKKFMRRVIPFYSWMRGAIPALIDSGLRNPGRVTMFNKASYNAAVAAGINPDSIYDPFPDDQLFPSFLANQVQGPQLRINDHYWSISPGISSWDVANTFTDPVAGVTGMISPIIRAPIEIKTGTSLTTGAKIKDPSDYLDQQIPYLGAAGNITGASPTGTVAGLLSGNGVDQQLQERKGNKTSDDHLASLMSWLTGVQATDESRPNFIKYAQFEKKNARQKLANGQATGF